MTIEIPVAQGVELYIFEGGSIGETVAAYNRFSGGGCRPALWGLGVFYRCYAKLEQKQVLAMAEYFRDNCLPCDILGLEPGWQSASYPCSLYGIESGFRRRKNAGTAENARLPCEFVGACVCKRQFAAV